MPTSQALRRWEAAYFSADAQQQCDYSPGGFWTYEGDPDPSWQQAVEELAVVHGARRAGRVLEPADLLGAVADEQLEGSSPAPQRRPEVVVLDCRKYADGGALPRGLGVSEDGVALVQAAVAVRTDCGDAGLADGDDDQGHAGVEGALRCCRTHAFQDSHARKVMARVGGDGLRRQRARHGGHRFARRLHSRWRGGGRLARGCSASGVRPMCPARVARPLQHGGPAPAERRVEAPPDGPQQPPEWRTVRMAYRKAWLANDAAFRTQWLSSMGCRGNAAGAPEEDEQQQQQQQQQQ